MMKIKTLKMARKLIFWNVLIIILPIIVLSNSILMRYQRDFEGRAKDQLNTTFKEITFSIDENISMMQGLLLSISNNSELVNKIGKKSDYTQEDILLIDQVYARDMESLIYSYPKINALRIFNDNDQLYEFWPVIYHLGRITDPTLFKQLIEEKKFWKILEKDQYFDIYINKIEKGKTISFFSNVKRPLSDYNVIVEVSMDLDVFFRGLENSSDTEGEFYYILQDGKIIDHSEQVEEILNIDQQLFERDLIRHFRNESDKIVALDHEEIKVIGNLYHIQQGDITIYRGVSLKKYGNVLSGERNKLILLMCFFSIFLFIVIRSITSVLFIRLQNLILSVKQMDKSKPKEFPVVEGKDEISDLSLHIKEMIEEIDALNQISLYEQQLAKDAQIKALLSQINEHFIYNMLENFKMMAEIDESYELSNLITKFGDLLRYSMDWKNKKTVPLYEEIDSIKKYIDLMNSRYDYEISLDLHIEEELMLTEILKMSIQPIIENAFLHGIEPKSEDSIITIDVHCDPGFEEDVLVTVSDNGVGMGKEHIQRINNELQSCDMTQSAGVFMGIGIKNINDRIKMYFGIHYGLHFESLEGLYTKVTIKLPKGGEKNEGLSR